MSRTDSHPHSGDQPDGGGGGHAANTGGPTKQDSTSEKADSGNNLRCHAAGITGAASERVPDHREGRGTERNQSHGTSASRLLFALPFNSDPSTADQR